MGWSRILATKDEVDLVKKFFREKGGYLTVTVYVCILIPFNLYAYIGLGLGGSVIAAIVGFFKYFFALKFIL